MITTYKYIQYKADMSYRVYRVIQIMIKKITYAFFYKNHFYALNFSKNSFSFSKKKKILKQPFIQKTTKKSKKFIYNPSAFFI